MSAMPNRIETAYEKELLGAPGLTTRSKDATRGLLASLLGGRTLLGAMKRRLGKNRFQEDQHMMLMCQI